MTSVLHAIIYLAHDTRSDDTGHGIIAWSLGNTHGWTMSSVAWPRRPWAAHTVVHRKAFHAIISLRKHTQSDDVGYGMQS